MNRIIKFGENVKGYNIPVLNEREVRAAAGILFLATFISLMYILFEENFVPIRYVLTFFLLDLLIRVIVNPEFSPTLILARLIVGNQEPEYVGAAQKKFAWIIGVVLASAMFVYFNILNAYGPVTGIICLVCLVFLFAESAFGICLGCMFYPLFVKKRTEYCSGGICGSGQKKEIRKISPGQLSILIAFVCFAVIFVYAMNDRFSEKPYNLSGIRSSGQTK